MGSGGNISFTREKGHRRNPVTFFIEAARFFLLDVHYHKCYNINRTNETDNLFVLLEKPDDFRTSMRLSGAALWKAQ